MHTHAPKETFKLSRTKEREREREREKRNERQSRGERQKRTKSVAVLAFFLPTVLCVFVLLVTNSLEEFSPSLWLFCCFFLKRKISPFFLCSASQKKNHPHKFTLYIFLFTHKNERYYTNKNGTHFNREYCRRVG